jgi:ATP-dependent Clp protease ATP-binding subunit ClpB
MMMDKFTEKAKEALGGASEAAFLKNHIEVTPWHLIKALIVQSGGIVPALLDGVGVSAGRVAELVDKQLDSLATQEGAGETYTSAELKAVIKGAFREAEALKDAYVSTEHLLLAILAKSAVSELLHGLGITRDKTLGALEGVRGSESVVDANPEAKYQALERFTIDLVAAARAGKIDPVIGREEEIRRTTQILSRRTKNNPVLIGDPGVGKTGGRYKVSRRVRGAFQGGP